MSTPDNYLECVQGSELWAKLRCGYITPSRARDAFDVSQSGKSKGQYKATRADYLTELVCERLTGIPYPHYVSAEMQWGREHEAEARAAYELHAAELVDTTGFVLHPSVSMFGASPDGLVGDDGLIEIKCPATKTHLETLRSGVIPIEHCFQLLGELSCTGRQWVDFVSFDPRMPAHLQLFVKRYQRDDKLVAAVEVEVAHFNREIEEAMQSLPAAPSPVAELLDHNDEDEAQF